MILKRMAPCLLIRLSTVVASELVQWHLVSVVAALRCGIYDDIRAALAISCLLWPTTIFYLFVLMPGINEIYNDFDAKRMNIVGFCATIHH